MYKKVTILIFILACSVSFAMGQTSFPHGEHDPYSTPLQKEKVLKVFPNPATSRINFQILNNNENSYEIIVYNFLGKRVDDIKNISSSVTSVNLSNYYSGIYIYQLRDNKGNLVESGKFNVIRQ